MANVKNKKEDGCAMYETPEMEIFKFDADGADVITASNVGDSDYDFPMGTSTDE